MGHATAIAIGARIAAAAAAMFTLTTVAALLAVAALPSLIPGWATTAVVTSSMAPAIDAGDVVVLGPSGRNRMGLGTVVRFPAPDGGSPIVHRIVALDRPAQAWVTRGDANRADDRVVVPFDRVDGIGAAVVPGAGHLVMWLGSKPLTAVALSAAAATTVAASVAIMAMRAFGSVSGPGSAVGASASAGTPLTHRRLDPGWPSDEAGWSR